MNIKHANINITTETLKDSRADMKLLRWASLMSVTETACFAGVPFLAYLFMLQQIEFVKSEPRQL